MHIKKKGREIRFLTGFTFQKENFLLCNHRNLWYNTCILLLFLWIIVFHLIHSDESQQSSPELISLLENEHHTSASASLEPFMSITSPATLCWLIHPSPPLAPEVGKANQSSLTFLPVHILWWDGAFFPLVAEGDSAVCVWLPGGDVTSEGQDVSFGFLKAPCSRWARWHHHILQPQPLLHFSLCSLLSFFFSFAVLSSSSEGSEPREMFCIKNVSPRWVWTVEGGTCPLWDFHHRFAKSGQKVGQQQRVFEEDFDLLWR